MNILSISNLSKSFKNIKALDSVSIDIPKGAVFGILGPNGSGKTTLLSTVLNILFPESGEIQLFEGPADHHARKRVGVLLETPNFYHYLNAVDNLKVTAAIKGKGEENIEKVLKIVDLWERRDFKFKSFSLGMKQRLAIASALLADPELLILDEPTNGLDPVGILDIRNLIISLGKQGISILMASHLLDEVEKVCTHVAILQKGKVLASGSVSEILSNEEQLILSSEEIETLLEKMRLYPGVSTIRLENGKVVASFPKGTCKPGEVNAYCFQQGVTLNGLQLRAQSLEARFFELTQAQ